MRVPSSLYLMRACGSRSVAIAFPQPIGMSKREAGDLTDQPARKGPRREPDESTGALSAPTTPSDHADASLMGAVPASDDDLIRCACGRWFEVTSRFCITCRAPICNPCYLEEPTFSLCAGCVIRSNRPFQSTGTTVELPAGTWHSYITSRRISHDFDVSIIPGPINVSCCECCHVLPSRNCALCPRFVCESCRYWKAYATSVRGEFHWEVLCPPCAHDRRIMPHLVMFPIIW